MSGPKSNKKKRQLERQERLQTRLQNPSETTSNYSLSAENVSTVGGQLPSSSKSPLVTAGNKKQSETMARIVDSKVNQTSDLSNCPINPSTGHLKQTSDLKEGVNKKIEENHKASLEEEANKNSVKASKMNEPANTKTNESTSIKVNESTSTKTNEPTNTKTNEPTNIKADELTRVIYWSNKESKQQVSDEKNLEKTRSSKMMQNTKCVDELKEPTTQSTTMKEETPRVRHNTNTTTAENSTRTCCSLQ